MVTFQMMWRICPKLRYVKGKATSVQKIPKNPISNPPLVYKGYCCIFKKLKKGSTKTLICKKKAYLRSFMKIAYLLGSIGRLATGSRRDVKSAARCPIVRRGTFPDIPVWNKLRIKTKFIEFLSYETLYNFDAGQDCVWNSGAFVLTICR